MTVIHQDHDYNHSSGGFRQVWFGSEAQTNLELAGGNLLNIKDADLLLTSAGSVALRWDADNLPEPDARDYVGLMLTQAKRGHGEKSLQAVA